MSGTVGLGSRASAFELEVAVSGMSASHLIPDVLTKIGREQSGDGVRFVRGRKQIIWSLANSLYQWRWEMSVLFGGVPATSALVHDPDHSSAVSLGWLPLLFTCHSGLKRLNEPVM